MKQADVPAWRCWGAWLCAWLCAGQAWGALTDEQRGKLDELKQSLTEARRAFGAQEWLNSLQSVEQAQQQMLALGSVHSRELEESAKPLYAELIKARQRLEFEGAEITALPTWADIVRQMRDARANQSEVTFASDVAPWLIAKCGGCHVDQDRGGFSMASLDDLSAGVRGAPVLRAGDARGSRIVTVIETGDMPRGGGRVSEQELSQLKQWIADGAKLEGLDRTQSLRALADSGNTAMASNDRPNPSPSSPEGSISFSKDIAPILVENCNGCHIAGRRASGQLRMDSYAQLMRGGTSGEAISGTNANASLLIRKLRGQEGQRMPAGGKPPLPDEQISLISAWIRSGAEFDGPSPDANISDVVNAGWASDASHDQLFAKRRERSLADWSRAVPNEQPETAENNEFFVLGNVSQTRMDAALERLALASKQVKKSLRLESNEVLVKGGITVFVLKNRYDYSEFGRMTESRELPKNWLGHWQAGAIDVYGVLADEIDMPDKQANAVALQVVTGAYVGSFDGVPNWFAEGIARNLVVTVYRRGDERIKQWQRELPLAIQKVSDAQTLLEDRLDEEAAGLAGMALTNFMMASVNRQRFERMMGLMRDGKDFNQSITFAYAPPEMVVNAWLGKRE